MSQWTHVAGCIRVDEICLEPSDHLATTTKLKQKFRNPPSGSEGPIHYHVVRTGKDHSLAWGLIYLWGDLRDFGDPEVPRIFKWLNKACSGLIIRSCIVKIDVEFGPTYVISGIGDNSLRMTQVE